MPLHCASCNIRSKSTFCGECGKKCIEHTTPKCCEICHQLLKGHTCTGQACPGIEFCKMYHKHQRKPRGTKIEKFNAKRPRINTELEPINSPLFLSPTSSSSITTVPTSNTTITVLPTSIPSSVVISPSSSISITGNRQVIEKVTQQQIARRNQIELAKDFITRCTVFLGEYHSFFTTPLGANYAMKIAQNMYAQVAASLKTKPFNVDQLILKQESKPIYQVINYEVNYSKKNLMNR